MDKNFSNISNAQNANTIFQIAIPYTKNALAQNNLIIGIVVAIISILLCLVANIIIEKYLPFLYGNGIK